MGSQKDRKALGCIGRSVNDQPTNPVCGKSPIIELLNVSKICFVEKGTPNSQFCIASKKENNRTNKMYTFHI